MKHQALLESAAEATTILPIRNRVPHLLRFRLTRIAIVSFVFGFFAFNTPVSLIAGEGAFSNPTEGQQFDVNDAVRVEFAADPDSGYTIRLRRIQGGYDSSFNATTNSEGVYSYLEISGGTLPVGDYTLQLIEGNNNPNGTSIDSITFKVMTVEM